MMTTAGSVRSRTGSDLIDIARAALPDEFIFRHTPEEVRGSPSFLSALNAAGKLAGQPFETLPLDVQQTLIERRLVQLIEICRTNPLWRARIDSAIGRRPLTSIEAFQQIPPTDKEMARLFYTGDRPGMVVPISHGGFQVATSGGTASGRPTEIVYPLDELQDTYRLAGGFIGRHVVERQMPGNVAKWVVCTLADHMMWSSSSMVGGVLQNIPDVNFIGAGAVDANVFGRILAYPGSKAIMGISRSIADLVSFAEHVPATDRATLRIALYGSGALQPKVHEDLKALYPNLSILSFFAAMQAETIGLQLDPASPVLTAIPGLHLVEIVDDENRWVGVGEEGDLLVTRLFGNGAPVLRYRLGDRVIRRPDLISPGLNALCFEYVGRSSDRFVLADVSLYAPTVLASVVDALRDAGLVDLTVVADDIQIRIDHVSKTLNIVAVTKHEQDRASDAERAEAVIRAAVAPEAETRLRGEGYRFALRLVSPGSPDLHTTDVGKTPLLVERH